MMEKEKSARHWKYWVVSIPNLRAAAISKLLTYVNHRIAYYMQIMSSGAMGMELYQKAHGKGSKIQVDLRTPGGTYVASSGGERRRVDLAVFLGLFDLLQMSSGIHFNVLVCDEIMDGLSPAGVRKLASVFREKADEGMAVYVISHNPAVQQVCQFDTVQTIERRGGRANLIDSQEPAHV
jgi:DNA repair exonuclease SbcCD ATPase subunit